MNAPRGSLTVAAVSLALVAAYAPGRRGRAYGLYNAVKGAGYVVSPVIGGAIVWKSHFGGILPATAAVSGIAFFLSLRLANPPLQAGAVFIDEDDGFSLAIIRTVFQERGLLVAASRLHHPTLWPWYVVTVVNMSFVGILFGFLPVRVHELGCDPLTAGLLLTTVAASHLLLQPVAGTLADRVGPAWTIHTGWCCRASGSSSCRSCAMFRWSWCRSSRASGSGPCGRTRTLSSAGLRGRGG